LGVPRPIGWISTRSVEGVGNLAPFSYFNVVASRPPHVAFSAGNGKDTLDNARRTAEFVVNVVSRSVVREMNLTSARVSPEVDEFHLSGLAASASRTVGAPRVARATAHLECRVAGVLPVGDSTLVVGEVVHLHVAAAVWRNGRVDPELLDPVARLSGSLYATLGDIFRLQRPDP
jgi:flavin reductase (DIM6/NTAB) family NADH-FMN oxidoreductase RutF